MEQLIILAVLVILSGLHSWWKKRQEMAEAQNGDDPNVPTQRRAVPPLGRPTIPAADFEEQIRRLLQGERPAQPTSPPLVPPPLPRPAPARARTPVVLPPPRPAGSTTPRVGSLEESAQAFLRTSQIESKVAEHMHGGEQMVVSRPTPEVKKAVAPEIRQAVTLLRHRQSQRAAIIAGIVLGPPKAQES
jgi:hypothetical protein